MPAISSISEHLVIPECLVPGVFNTLVDTRISIRHMNCSNISWASLWENGVVELYCVLCDWVFQTLWLRWGIISSKEILIRIFPHYFPLIPGAAQGVMVVFVGLPTGSSHHPQQSSCHSWKSIPLIPSLLSLFLQPLLVTSQQIWKPFSGRPWYSGCGLQTSSINITWDPVGSTGSRAPSMTFWARICI